MQYFVILFWITVALLPVSVFFFRASTFQKNFIHNNLQNLLLNQKYYSSLAVNRLTNYINKQPSRQKEQLLDDILQKNLPSLVKHINDSQLKTLLKMLINAKTPRLTNETDALILLLSSDIFVSQRFYSKAAKILNTINDKPCSAPLAALKLFIEAKLALTDGDLLNSSAWCIQAISIFHHHHLFYEEAEARFTLSNIYRSGKFFDSSEIMLYEAKKIFKALNANQNIAKVFCSLGILTAAQERWNEADSFFNEAAQISENLSDKKQWYYLCCYRALMDVALNNPKAALSKLQFATQYEQDKNIAALQADILAQAYSSLNNHRQALQFAQQALHLYISARNHTAAEQTQILIEKLFKQNHKIS